MKAPNCYLVVVLPFNFKSHNIVFLLHCKTEKNNGGLVSQILSPICIYVKTLEHQHWYDTQETMSAFRRNSLRICIETHVIHEADSLASRRTAQSGYTRSCCGGARTGSDVALGQEGRRSGNQLDIRSGYQEVKISISKYCSLYRREEQSRHKVYP